MLFLCQVSGLIAIIFLVTIPVYLDGKNVKAVTLEVDSLEQLLLVSYHPPHPSPRVCYPECTSLGSVNHSIWSIFCFCK